MSYAFHGLIMHNDWHLKCKIINVWERSFKFAVKLLLSFCSSTRNFCQAPGIEMFYFRILAASCLSALNSFHLVSGKIPAHMLFMILYWQLSF